jgi:hypothetical protein
LVADSIEVMAENRAAQAGESSACCFKAGVGREIAGGLADLTFPVLAPDAVSIPSSRPSDSAF